MYKLLLLPINNSNKFGRYIRNDNTYLKIVELHEYVVAKITEGLIHKSEFLDAIKDLHQQAHHTFTSQSKDLEMIACMAPFFIQQDGIHGLKSLLQLLYEVITTMWSGLFPSCSTPGYLYQRVNIFQEIDKFSILMLEYTLVHKEHNINLITVLRNLQSDSFDQFILQNQHALYSINEVCLDIKAIIDEIELVVETQIKNTGEEEEYKPIFKFKSLQKCLASIFSIVDDLNVINAKQQEKKKDDNKIHEESNKDSGEQPQIPENTYMATTVKIDNDVNNASENLDDIRKYKENQHAGHESKIIENIIVSVEALKHSSEKMILYKSLQFCLGHFNQNNIGVINELLTNEKLANILKLIMNYDQQS